ncbi:MAG: MarR family transcriptional regulator [Pseudorhodoplanes sp.]|jgi:DNA-binding MarR family transcriptional regulator|nr:MarR family transcriptional regulator [Pseudorhodoplanes sp.]
MALPTQAQATSAKDDQTVRFEIANRLFFRLYQASNLMHKTGSRSVAEFETTTQQWAVLGALSRPSVRDRGMTVKELIEFLLLSRQNLTAVLNRLQGQGLIERTRIAEDGRVRRICLTPSGTDIWAHMLMNISGYYERALVDFTTEETLLLYRLLDRLKSRLQTLSSEPTAP